MVYLQIGFCPRPWCSGQLRYQLPHSFWYIRSAVLPSVLRSTSTHPLLMRKLPSSTSRFFRSAQIFQVCNTGRSIEPSGLSSGSDSSPISPSTSSTLTATQVIYRRCSSQDCSGPTGRGKHVVFITNGKYPKQIWFELFSLQAFAMHFRVDSYTFIW